MIRRILITGGSGFIGTNLMEYYVQKGEEIISFDKKAPRNKDHFKFWREVDIMNNDILDKELTRFNPEYVIHLAARTDLQGNDISDYVENSTGTQNLISALNKINSVKRVIFTSSMLVCKLGYQPRNETDFCASTAYGQSKILMEKIIRLNDHNYEWAIIRPTSIWGPWFAEPYKDFFKSVIKKRYFHIGSNNCLRTYGYVENSIYQIDQILESEYSKISHKVLYIGDYDPVNIQKWANEIANILGHNNKKIPFFIVRLIAWMGDLLIKIGFKFPMSTFRYKNMTTDYVLDLTLTKSIAPVLPIGRTSGILNTLQWLKNN